MVINNIPNLKRIRAEVHKANFVAIVIDRDTERLTIMVGDTIGLRGTDPVLEARVDFFWQKDGQVAIACKGPLPHEIVFDVEPHEVSYVKPRPECFPIFTQDQLDAELKRRLDAFITDEKETELINLFKNKLK